MKRLAFPILIAVGAVFLMMGVLWAVQDPLVLENKYGNVEFSHQKHADKECKECHHTFKAGDKSPTPCRECHKTGAEVTMKKAAHTRCKGCHKELAKGPTKCKECHKK